MSETPDRQRQLDVEIAAEAKRAVTLTEVMLESLAYESAYRQRRINSMKTSEREADYSRGYLMALKLMAQRLKGEVKYDD
jgi:hypothetical protein